MPVATNTFLWSILHRHMMAVLEVILAWLMLTRCCATKLLTLRMVPEIRTKRSYEKSLSQQKAVSATFFFVSKIFVQTDQGSYSCLNNNFTSRSNGSIDNIYLWVLTAQLLKMWVVYFLIVMQRTNTCRTDGQHYALPEKFLFYYRNIKKKIRKLSELPAPF